MKHNQQGEQASGLCDAHSNRVEAPVMVPSEMAIVDTFTRLIFGDAGQFQLSELQVIEALRAVEPSVAADDLDDMGEYLRALGVGEMVELVSRVQQCAACSQPPPVPADTTGAIQPQAY